MTDGPFCFSEMNSFERLFRGFATNATEVKKIKQKRHKVRFRNFYPHMHIQQLVVAFNGVWRKEGDSSRDSGSLLLILF